MFDTLISKPIFNILTFIYAVVPGHNFGLAVIIFTIIIRFLLWPLLKKQLHNTKKMRELQPELKRIKKEANKDKRRESELTMQLYKEKGINPLGSLGTAFLQLPILFALFHGITKIVNDPNTIVSYSYGWVQNLPWMKELAGDISKLDFTLFDVVNLNEKALSQGKVYLPALVIVLASAVIQYFASKMLMVTDTQARSLKQILKDAAGGKEADQAEVSASTMKLMIYFIPVMILVTSINFAAALGVYWLTSGIVQYFQQRRILGQDQGELVALAESGGVGIVGEVIPPKPSKPSKKKRR